MSQIVGFGKSWKILSVLLFTAIVWGCSKEDKGTDTRYPSLAPTQDTFQVGRDEIGISDELGNPIAGAKVLIGTAESMPFGGNLLTADDQGKITIPAGWGSKQPVTVDAPGHLRATFLSQSPGARVYQIRRKEIVGEFELKGVTTGYTVKNGDGLVDFGLVMSTFRKRDLFNFDIGMVTSPYKDVIEIIGNQVKLPSNVALPKQTERYIFSVNLNKPNYRLYFKTPGTKNVFAVRGRFPLDKIIDGYQDNKEIIEMVNFFDMLGGTFAEATIADKSTSLDINVTQATYSKKKNVKAAPLTKDEVMIGLALRDVGGSLHPTDVKIFETSKAALALDHGDDGAPILLAALKRRSEMKSGPGADRVSAAFLPLTENATPTLLPLLADPIAKTNEGVAVKAIMAPAGVKKLATYVVLSRIVPRGRSFEDSGDNTMLSPLPEPAATTLDNAWEVYSEGWIDAVTLPKWPGESGLRGTLKWEVSMVGSQKEYDSHLGPGILDFASHAAHASVDVVVP